MRKKIKKIKSVLFLTPRRSDKYFGGEEKHVKILSEKLRERGIGVGELFLSDVGAKNNKLRMWQYLWKNRKLVLGSDIIHVHDIFWWYSPFRLLFFWKPVFVTFHGWEGVYPPSKSAILQKKWANLLCRGSIGVGKYLEKWYGVELDEVTYGAIASSKFKVESSKFKNVTNKIVVLGRLEKVNGINTILKALNKLNRKAIFVGDGSCRKKCEKYGEVTGMVKNVNKYLEKADLVIASSYLSIMEAMALGKLVIAIGDNPLKLDYLNCHPMADSTRICSNYQEVVGVISEIGNKGGGNGPTQWALKQTPEKLTGLYLKLWKK